MKILSLLFLFLCGPAFAVTVHGNWGGPTPPMFQQGGQGHDAAGAEAQRLASETGRARIDLGRDTAFKALAEITQHEATFNQPDMTGVALQRARASYDKAEAVYNEAFRYINESHAGSPAYTAKEAAIRDLDAAKSKVDRMQQVVTDNRIAFAHAHRNPNRMRGQAAAVNARVAAADEEDRSEAVQRAAKDAEAEVRKVEQAAIEKDMKRQEVAAQEAETKRLEENKKFTDQLKIYREQWRLEEEKAAKLEADRVAAEDERVAAREAANEAKRIDKETRKATAARIRHEAREKALCFPGETPISVKDDSLKGYHSAPISSIHVGDSVISCNLELEGGVCEVGQVEDVIRNTADHLIKLSFDGKSVKSTDNHPFYVVEKKDWVEAQDLRVGDHLRTLSGGVVALDDIEVEKGEFTVFNLDVRGNHNYYACDVLVHNCHSLLMAAVVAEGALVANPIGAAAVGVGAGIYLGQRVYNALNSHSDVEQKVADKVLEGAEKLPNRRNYFTDQFQKQGGVEQAQKDFKELANKGSIEQIQGKPEGWLKGKTADGSNVMVRPDSSGGKPTIQIDKPDGHTIKIRY